MIDIVRSVIPAARDAAAAAGRPEAALACGEEGLFARLLENVSVQKDRAEAELAQKMSAAEERLKEKLACGHDVVLSSASGAFLLRPKGRVDRGVDSRTEEEKVDDDIRIKPVADLFSSRRNKSLFR